MDNVFERCFRKVRDFPSNPTRSTWRIFEIVHLRSRVWDKWDGRPRYSIEFSPFERVVDNVWVGKVPSGGRFLEVDFELFSRTSLQQHRHIIAYCSISIGSILQPQSVRVVSSRLYSLWRQLKMLSTATKSWLFEQRDSSRNSLDIP